MVGRLPIEMVEVLEEANLVEDLAASFVEIVAVLYHCRFQVAEVETVQFLLTLTEVLVLFQLAFVYAPPPSLSYMHPHLDQTLLTFASEGNLL